MHLEIEVLLNSLPDESPSPSAVVLQNAEKLLDYMEDINLERDEKFEFTPAESLYVSYNVGGWEFHMECIKNGKILYTFRKGRYGIDYGSCHINRFLPKLEKYLMMII
jgi:hypothetical protein